MNKNFEKLHALIFALFFIIIVIGLSFFGLNKSETEYTNDFATPTTISVQYPPTPFDVAKTNPPYVCPQKIDKLCEAYDIIQKKYIRKISDEELTGIFMEGITREFREPDSSKTLDLKIVPGNLVCSPNLQKLCDVYDTVKNKYGERLSDKKLVEMFINGFITVIKETDPYSKYASSVEENIDYFQYSGVGIVTEKQESFPFHLLVRVSKENNPAYLAGIRHGDRITHINGDSVINKSTKQLNALIRGKKGTSVRLTVIQGCNEKSKDITLIRQDTRDVMSGAIKKLDGKIGYIRLAEFNAGSAIKIRTGIENFQDDYGKMNGLILDLRNNPGGQVLEASKIIGLFVDKGSALFEQGQKGNYISWDLSPSSNDMLHGKPIVVLVNKDSASASEITSGALQDYKRATIVGTNTYGKGCLQKTWHMKDKSILYLTGGYTFTPTQKAINKVGIQPDVFVLEGKNESCTGDEQLQKAIELLKSK